jgi:hypothetical protein
MTESQAARTRFMAQALGPILIAVALAVFMRYETLPLLLPAFTQDAPLIFVTGVFTLIAGFFVLAAHHHLGSPAAVACTGLAVIFILRGLSLAIFPDLAIGVATQVARAPIVLLAATSIAGLVGVWLTFVGWFGKSV